MRVLVVEDHEDSLSSLVQYLNLCGFEVVGVHDAEAGLASYQLEGAEVVLTDIHLPGMSGCELARAIRALHGPAPRINAMSGVPLPKQEQALFEHFFLKPLNLNSLSAVLLHY
ncbi:response regulator [Roseateles chitinivorans]|uniref:response regulator n=1 Tax=Roseateles chitinivorans TaxID=2917965 RepID=UPI003D670590